MDDSLHEGFGFNPSSIAKELWKWKKTLRGDQDFEVFIAFDCYRKFVILVT